MSSHVLIPDTQVKPGVKLDHLIWASKFIKDVKPDKVIIIGDWWDLAKPIIMEQAERS
jgi:hypothetical protein